MLAASRLADVAAQAAGSTYRRSSSLIHPVWGHRTLRDSSAFRFLRLRLSSASEIFQKALIPVCVQVDANDGSSFWEQRSPIFYSGLGQ